MINFPLYSLIADVMQRLGIQPITPEEIAADRRTNFQGRRSTDGLGSFLLDHLILDAIGVCVVVLLYALFHS